METIGTGKIRKRKSLISRMKLVIILITIFYGIVFMCASVVLTQRAERDYEIRESETILNNIASSIIAKMDSYKDISRLVMMNEDVTKYLRAKSADVGMANDARFGIYDVINVSTNIDSIMIIRNDGTQISNNRDAYILREERLKDPDWYNPILEKSGGVIIRMNADDAVVRVNGEPLLTIEREINDILTQKRTGILLMNISMRMIDRITFDQGEDRVCVLDDKGNYLSGSVELFNMYDPVFDSTEYVHKELRNGLSTGMVSGCRIKGIPLIVLCRTEADTDVVPRETVYMLILIFIAFLLSVIIAGAFVNKNLTRHIIELSNAMEKTKSKGWLEKIDVNVPENEFGMLADSYNSMITYMNELFNKSLENEKMMRKAEMRVLHEQIKPHFLYNSLETIDCMALDVGAAEVHSAVETLGSFYRNFLSHGDREIPLAREIAIIKDYLSLQKLRYGDIIRDEYDIDEDAKGCMIPKLLLQPLVENSIYHGIRLKGEEGLIKITARLLNDGIHITVYDTGVGMSEDVISRILATKTDDEIAGEAGQISSFGLRGTIQRIRYYCDSDDVVRITSELGEYTQIEIVIPYLIIQNGGKSNVQSDAN